MKKTDLALWNLIFRLYVFFLVTLFIKAFIFFLKLLKVGSTHNPGQSIPTNNNDKEKILPLPSLSPGLGAAERGFGPALVSRWRGGGRKRLQGEKVSERWMIMMLRRTEEEERKMRKK